MSNNGNSHQKFFRIFKYRIYPTKSQVDNLNLYLDMCCELYNSALQERRNAWKIGRKSINYYDQSTQLPEIKKERPEFYFVQGQILQNVLKRIDKTFKAFFSRVQSGVTPGYPRFKSKRNYNSFTFPQGVFRVKNSRVKLSRIGPVKIKLHRPIEGKIKTLTIKRQEGKWFAFFACEVEFAPLLVSTSAVGIDVGLANFATLSDKTHVANPRFDKLATKKIRNAQRKVSRRKKGSKGFRTAVILLQRTYAKSRNQKQDFHHKESRKLVNKFGAIFVEDLNLVGLARGILRKSVADAGWGQFLNFIAYKAESAGRVFAKVNPNGTSQECSKCSHREKDNRKTQSEFICQNCNYSTNADYNAALNILGRGLRLQASTQRI